jgi:NMT1/THI5 like
MLDRRCFLSLLSFSLAAKHSVASDYEAFSLRFYFEENHSFFGGFLDYLVKFISLKHVGLKLIRVATLEEADCAVVSFPALLRQNPLQFNLLMNLVERPSLDFIGRRSRWVGEDLHLLNDKTIAYAVGDNRVLRFKQLLALKGNSAQSLRFEEVGRHVLEPLLAAGEVDAILGEAHRHLTGLKARGVPAQDLFALNFQDEGLQLYGLGFAAKKVIIAEQSAQLVAFMGVLYGQMRALEQDLTPLINAEISKNSQLEAPLLQEELSSYLRDNIFTPHVTANGFGVYTRERFEKSLINLGLAEKFTFDTVINASLLRQVFQ